MGGQEMARETGNGKRKNSSSLWVFLVVGLILLLYFASLESRLASRSDSGESQAAKDSLQSIDALSADIGRLQDGLRETEEKLVAHEVQMQQDGLEGVGAAGVPVGTVAAYAGEGRTGPPSGWLLCDGSETGREQYPDLFATIGTLYGEGDGSTTFSLPDYRGLFLRGVDDADGPGGRPAAGRDVDAAERVHMTSGAMLGDFIGTVQGDATRSPNSPFVTNADGSHEHEILWSRDGGGGLDGVRHAFQSSPNRYGKTTLPHQDDPRQPEVDGVHLHAIDPTTGDRETRPKNASVNWIIKATVW